jgi:hypothetical protein
MVCIYSYILLDLTISYLDFSFGTTPSFQASPCRFIIDMGPGTLHRHVDEHEKF